MTIFLVHTMEQRTPVVSHDRIGITLQRAFSLDIKTLSKLNFYLVLAGRNF